MTQTCSTYTCTHTITHTITQIHTCIHTQKHLHIFTHTIIYTNACTHMCIHTRTRVEGAAYLYGDGLWITLYIPSRSKVGFLGHANSFSLSLLHTHFFLTHIHTHTLFFSHIFTHTHTHTLSLSLSLSLSHTHTPSLCLTCRGAKSPRNLIYYAYRLYIPAGGGGGDKLKRFSARFEQIVVCVLFAH